ncbi:MAG: hypothetical protein ABI782_07880 [Anaerolineaceae bacterium]
MGEKEQGAAQESGRQNVEELHADREASAPSVSERKAGETKGKDLERGGGMTHEDDWEAPASLATGDLDGDGSAEKTVHLWGLPPGQPSAATMPPPVRVDSTPARASEGGGSEIAIGDPGVNGN